MSTWPHKFVIGLTGNIATGKSVVRKMLEHLGAYGIDADALSHRAIVKGAPGYEPVVEAFGSWILGSDDQIDRKRLGEIVFSNPEALAILEGIIHPLVRQAMDVLVRRASQEVILIEAIKLLESGLHQQCDAVWVTASSPENQIKRLKQSRNASEEEAKKRVSAQGSQDEKIRAADVVFHNDGSYEELWEQVKEEWEQIHAGEEEPTPKGKKEEPVRDELTTQRAGPNEVKEIAEFITQQSDGDRHMQREDVMAAFGEKAFLLLKFQGQIVGLLGWQVENLVARVDDIFIQSDVLIPEALKVLTQAVEAASRELQGEAALVFMSPQLAQYDDVWQELGYVPREPGELSVLAWQEAAMKSQPPGMVMYFKRLRKDRVLHPV